MLLSASFLAETLVRSPRKFVHFRYLKNYFLDHSIQEIFYFILKKEALVLLCPLVHCTRVGWQLMRTGAMCSIVFGCLYHTYPCCEGWTCPVLQNFHLETPEFLTFLLPKHLCVSQYGAKPLYQLQWSFCLLAFNVFFDTVIQYIDFLEI